MSRAQLSDQQGRVERKVWAGKLARFIRLAGR
jgi:hypothetical protein